MCGAGIPASTTADPAGGSLVCTEPEAVLQWTAKIYNPNLYKTNPTTWSELLPCVPQFVHVNMKTIQISKLNLNKLIKKKLPCLW